MWRQLYIHKKNDLVGLLSHTLEQINSTWTKNPTITAIPRNFFQGKQQEIQVTLYFYHGFRYDNKETWTTMGKTKVNRTSSKLEALFFVLKMTLSRRCKKENP